MASRCQICGKGPISGRTISHSHRATLRRWTPNLHVVRGARIDGRTRKITVCTRCLRSNLVKKGS